MERAFPKPKAPAEPQTTREAPEPLPAIPQQQNLQILRQMRENWTLEMKKLHILMADMAHKPFFKPI